MATDTGPFTVRDILGEPTDGPTGTRGRGLRHVSTAFTNAHAELRRASEWANELTAVPTDLRRELAELVSRLSVLQGEVDRL